MEKNSDISEGHVNPDTTNKCKNQPDTKSDAKFKDIELEEDAECLICGEMIDVKATINQKSAPGIAAEKCLHTICAQCRDDYILIDPDSKLVVSCPLCVEANNS